MNLTKQLEIKEKEIILNVLDCFNNNQTKAALDLEIGRTTLISKMKKYNIKLCAWDYYK